MLRGETIDGVCKHVDLVVDTLVHLPDWDYSVSGQ